MTDLAGRHAVVTGGGTGVGAAIALALADAGAQVTITGRREAPLEATAKDHGRIGWLTCDVTDAGSVDRMMAEATGRHGAPDILVANAGAAESTPFSKQKPEDLRDALAVNLEGVANLWRSGLGAMKSGGWGRMIAISSTAGLKGYPYVSSYVAAKHAVIGLTKSLGLELARTGITVNSICPGFTETPLLERSIENIMEKTGRSRDEARASLTANNPQGRFIQPREIADAVLWLCSPTAGSVNGQAIAISGGET